MSFPQVCFVMAVVIKRESSIEFAPKRSFNILEPLNILKPPRLNSINGDV